MPKAEFKHATDELKAVVMRNYKCDKGHWKRLRNLKLGTETARLHAQRLSKQRSKGQSQLYVLHARLKAHMRRRRALGYLDGDLCDRWLVFESFEADLGEMPANAKLVPRIRSQPLSPTNFEWKAA